MRKLVYIANARLPTEKAHGYQIVKMCEAFAAIGAKVVLLHPYRRQTDPAMKGRAVCDYYGVQSVFETRILPNIDLLLFARCFSGKALTAVFFANSVLWGLFAAIKAGCERGDIYYTRGPEIAFWLTAFGLRTIYECHGIPKRAQRRLLLQLAKRKALHRVVALTSFIKNELVAMGFPSEKIVVAPDGVDLGLFQDVPNKEICRQRLGLPADRHIIGYIGRFQTMGMEKGIPELIEAMTLLPAVDSREPLLLCVGGPMELVPSYLDIVRRRNVSEEQVRFVDRVPNCEVPYWIRACDVVTIPWPWTEFSAYYTSPMKLFEYMAAGVPIVATDLPSIREVLRHRDTGWLVEAGNTKALAQGLEVVLALSDGAVGVAVNARNDVKRYTWIRRAELILGK